jgi:Cu(I)/Ag(I) efflux system membrane fusion protein
MGKTMLKKWFGWNSFKVLLILAAVFLVGYAVRGLRVSTEPISKQVQASESSGKTQQWWTCSMHPQIRQPGPGKCPICGMDLIPVSSSGAELGERQISFSEAAVKLMEITTTPVERKFVTAEVRMVGKVDYDETQVKNIAAWVPGRIDRLYVDFTGTTVNKGDHMVELYSPELISAQAELLQAVKAADNVKTTASDLVTRTTLATRDASREKLRLLGLTDEQISKMESAGRTVTHITIYSPIGGVVIHKNAMEGTYVTTGTPIYTVADLSRLWVKLDAYESDLSWIRYGQKVEFTTEAYPGEVFQGRVNFIDPVLDDRTRTVKLRVDVNNPEGKLKPEMFVRAVVRSQVAQGGKVMVPEMAGKWICPMHPAVVKSEPGTCDICGMKLVTTESLGYVVGTPKEAPLVIPATAPLITGTRAVVYVQTPEKDKPTFEGREVTLGPRAGDYYLVKDGLSEGEQVVTKGNFKIDSALQIEAKPSMMSAPAATQAEHQPSGEQAREAFEVPSTFREQLWGVVRTYSALHEALAGDDKDGAVKAAQAMKQSLSQVDMALLRGKAHEQWMADAGEIDKASGAIKDAGSIEAVRWAFEQLSNELVTVVGQFGIPENRTLYRFHCPMAFDNKGADWLQIDRDARNPYFGASMPKCSQVAEPIGVKRK